MKICTIAKTKQTRQDLLDWIDASHPDDRQLRLSCAAVSTLYLLEGTEEAVKLGREWYERSSVAFERRDYLWGQPPNGGTRTSTSFWAISHVFPSPAPPLKRRAACSPWCPRAWGADWCLRSDAVTNPVFRLGEGRSANKARGRVTADRTRRIQHRPFEARGPVCERTPPQV